jgi:biopolymer transport protein ExbD
MSDVKAEPNLTPMLDVVFQIMTFFLMVLNFSKDEYDLRVRLPIAGSAMPVDQAEDRLVLNLERDGNIQFGGRSYDTERLVQEIRVQSQLVRRAAEARGKPIAPEAGLPTTLVIRADRDTSYGQLYRLITACQGLGYRKFALKAIKSDERG